MSTRDDGLTVDGDWFAFALCRKCAGKQWLVGHATSESDDYLAMVCAACGNRAAIFIASNLTPTKPW